MDLDYIFSNKISEHMQAYISFMSDFKRGLFRAILRYDSKMNVYSKSWKRCTLDYLEKRLLTKVYQYSESDDDKHLVDIVNFALMIYERKQKME